MTEMIPLGNAVAQMNRVLASFYRALADKARKSRTRTVLQWLADDEDREVMVLEDTSLGHTSRGELDAAFAASNTIGRHLSGGDHALDIISEHLVDEAEIIRLAIRYKSDIVQFFHRLLQGVTDEDAAFRIYVILEAQFQRMRHLFVILNLLEKEKKRTGQFKAAVRK